MRLLINFLLLVINFYSYSQSNVNNIIDASKNTVIGDSSSLSYFFNALDSLKASKRRAISVVHIGDSHIQADYFSGTLRVLFQQKFGNAGRGLVFPYKIAHTNEPTNYCSGSLNEWIGVRNVINPNRIDIGISGITLLSKESNVKFNLQVKNQKNINYAFNSIYLFSKTLLPKNLINTSQLIDTAYGQKLENSYLSILKMKDTTHQITFQFHNQSQVDIHGLVLKNDSSGILYHSIGVNGASFKSYNNTSLFMEQLAYLKPDLIIVSLGTNESYDQKFDINEFNNEVNELINKIKKSDTSCSILLTTPADNYRIHKKKIVHNSKPKLISDYLCSYTKQHQLAVWNLYTVMGGKGSMKRWKEQKLSTRDYVHFTRMGYELQGELLFEAIMNSYSKNK